MKALLAFVLLASSGLAAAPAQAQQSVFSEPQRTADDPHVTANADEGAGSDAQKDLIVFANSFLYGPSLYDPSAGEAPSTWVGQPTGVSIQNQVGMQYNLTKSLSIAPVFDFEVVMTDPAFEYKKDQYLALAYDSFIKVGYTDLVDFDLGPHSAWLNADVRFYVPTSDFSRDNNSLGSLRLTLAPGMQFAQSSWSISMVNFMRYWLQSQTFVSGTTTNALPRLMLYTGPLVNYAASDSVNLWLLGEASMTVDTKGRWTTSQKDRSLVDLEPGIDFKIGKSITLSPYLNWFINQPLDTTSVNLTASLAI